MKIHNLLLHCTTNNDIRIYINYFIKLACNILSSGRTTARIEKERDLFICIFNTQVHNEQKHFLLLITM